MSLLSVEGANGSRPALVVFSGRADLAWLRVLKRGFRHCFVLVDLGEQWLLINPMSHYTAVDLCPGMTAEDLADVYRGLGLTVVPARTGQPFPRPAPWRPYTCVEEVMRILGIRAPWVLTPWQLYRRLAARKKYLT